MIYIWLDMNFLQFPRLPLVDQLTALPLIAAGILLYLLIEMLNYLNFQNKTEHD